MIGFIIFIVLIILWIYSYNILYENKQLKEENIILRSKNRMYDKIIRKLTNKK